MAKDPFANLPPIDPEDRAEPENIVAADHVEAAGDVSAGNPPRTLLKSAGKWAMPLMGLAVGIWFFMPDDHTAARRATTGPVEVDTARQADETSATIKRMREEAAKKPPVVVPVMPSYVPAQGPAVATAESPASSSVAARPSMGATSQESSSYTPASARPPLPPNYSGASQAPYPTPASHVDDKASERAAQAYAAAVARQEEIRASAIEVTKVKLMGQTSSEAAQPSVLAGLQADIADATRSESERSQQAMQERLLAAMGPKEPVKSKGANEEFLAANAAAANSAPILTRQMAPQASTIVNEGHVIRAVLLTRVNSDLPGRVLARVTSDVYDSKQRFVVIPKGSQLVGVYSSQVVVGQERLLMAMNRLILPNGSWVSLSGASAADMTGMSGVEADVNNHFMKMFGSSLVLGASTLLLPRSDTTVSTLQNLSGQAGGGGTAGSVFAMSLNEVLKTLLERNRQIPPTLSLREGEEFIFMVAQDIAMVPYRP
ncbi:TrbI/VirB10 family protein [Massilia aerilata]|uniref:TrbI/VirB10 family protein n=1 Tax=Massilia aerilata TaxID=453817 RepID=A0ABW0S2Q6_9BURK